MKNSIDTQIDEILEQFEVKDGIHTVDANDAIIALLEKSGCEWQMRASSWCNCEGEAVFIAWVEDGKLHTTCYDIIFNPEV